MAAERLLRILSRLATPDDGRWLDICQVAVEVTGVSGAGVMLFTDAQPQATVCSTDETSSLIEELQYSFGEGPCVDAHRLGRVVAEPDLAHAGSARWSAFSPPAVDAGARAVFGFPIRIGAVRLGALNLYRDRPGPLDDEHHSDALVVADVAARAVLAAQAAALPGDLAPDLEAATDQWLVVHQAAGMVSIQLDVTIEEALVRVRGHAFRTGRVVTAVAEDIVQRRLRLDADQ